MKYFTRTKLTIAMLLLLLTVGYCYGGMLLPADGVKITNVQIERLNAIAVDMEIGGQTVYIDIHYPEDRVLLVDAGDDGSNGIPYEPCYNKGSFLNGPRLKKYSWHEKPGYPLPEVSNMTVSRGLDRSVRHGIINGVWYRVDGPLGGKPLMETAVRALFAGPDSLISCIIPRVRVEQWMQGEWTKLLQYNPGAYRYKMAPVDPVQLQFEFVPMKVTFMRDRVLLLAGTEEEQKDMEYVIKRPRVGHWPVLRGSPEFFFKFHADTVSAVEKFEVSIPPSRNFSISFDVQVMTGGTLHPKILHMDLMKPDFQRACTGPWCHISDWPLLATPTRVKSFVDEETHYPDGYIVPRWAAETMFKLGVDYWDAGDPNDAIYSNELGKVKGEYIQKRREKNRRPNRH